MHLGVLAPGRLSAGDRPSLLRRVRLLFPVIADIAIISACALSVNRKTPSQENSTWNRAVTARINYEGTMFQLFRSGARFSSLDGARMVQ
jgi:hypothetical protein